MTSRNGAVLDESIPYYGGIKVPATDYGSGKTSMVQKLLETNFFKEKPVKVMVCIPKNMERFLEESTDDYKKSWNNIEIFEGRGVVRMG